MSVRKRFFTSEIARKIKQDLINPNSDLDILKTVAIGDLYLMPSPEELSHRDVALQYLPAVYIMPMKIENQIVSPSKSISNGVYNFVLKYVHYIDANDTSTVYEDALNNAGLIADTLLEDKNFEDQSISNAPNYIALYDSSGKAIGDILETKVDCISINEVDGEFFRSLNIPVIVAEIEYDVLFRSRHERS